MTEKELDIADIHNTILDLRESIKELEEDPFDHDSMVLAAQARSEVLRLKQTLKTLREEG